MFGSNGYWLPVILNILLATASYCIRITKISIPEYHILDKTDNAKLLVLDCEYEIDPSETGLVVKWSFGNDLIYQWIPKRKPFIMQPYMKGKIDVTYEISQNPIQKFRGLALINPTWNSTGSYTCSAETFESGDRKTSFVQIIDTSQSTVDICRSIVNEVEEISCITTNFYPQPVVNLTLNDETLPKKAEKIQLRDNGLFNVTAIATSSLLSAETDAEIGCYLYFPKTDYTVHKSLSFSGSSRTSQFYNLLILLILPTFIVSKTPFQTI